MPHYVKLMWQRSKAGKAEGNNYNPHFRYVYCTMHVHCMYTTILKIAQTKATHLTAKRATSAGTLPLNKLSHRYSNCNCVMTDNSAGTGPVKRFRANDK